MTNPEMQEPTESAIRTNSAFTQGHLVAVLVRLFAVYLLVSVVRGVAPTLMMLNSDGSMMALWKLALTCAGLLLPLGFALFLWFFNLTVAKDVLINSHMARLRTKRSASRQFSQALAGRLTARKLTRKRPVLAQTLRERLFWAICGVAVLAKSWAIGCALRLAAHPKKDSLAPYAS
jgi:hypothetical protein